MATKVYGYSDDLIELEGDLCEEVNFIGKEDGYGCFLGFNDGTMLEVRYGKGSQGIWSVVALSKGPLFDRIDVCGDENDDAYSDIAYLKDGVTCVYWAREWGRIKGAKL